MLNDSSFLNNMMIIPNNTIYFKKCLKILDTLKIKSLGNSWVNL